MQNFHTNFNLEEYIYGIISAKEKVTHDLDSFSKTFVVSSLPSLGLLVNPNLGVATMFASWVLSVLDHQNIHRDLEGFAKRIVLIDKNLRNHENM